MMSWVTHELQGTLILSAFCIIGPMMVISCSHG